jgi:hypothetical protein
VNATPVSGGTAPDEVIEEDYFRDMMPELRQQKRVLLHPADSTPDGRSQASGHRSNKFSVDASAVIAATRELGDLDDEPHDESLAWNEEELDMEQTVRAAREADRRRRQEENEERTRRSARENKSSRKSLTATKLS